MQSQLCYLKKWLNEVKEYKKILEKEAQVVGQFITQVPQAHAHIYVIQTQDEELPNSFPTLYP